MSVQIEIFPPDYSSSNVKQDIYESVVGHVLVLVIKKLDGSLDVERVVGINADSAEDNQIVGDFIHQVEDKLAEIFDAKEEPKIWTPE